MMRLIELIDFFNGIDNRPLVCVRHAAVPAAWNRKRLEPERIMGP